MIGIFRRLTGFDWVLLGCVFLLFSIGMAALYSIGLGKEPQDFYFFQKQGLTFLAGFVALIVFSVLNYRKIKNYSIPIYVLSCLLLGTVLFLGRTVRGTRGWFYIGSFGFQPVELAKIGLVLMLAFYMNRYARQISQFRHFLASAGLAAIPIALVMLQPDFGSALLLFFIWLGMVIMSGIPKKYLALIGLSSLVLLVCAWFFLFKPYQKDRVLTFINPSQEVAGRSYNVRQSLIAIGSGQWFGKGLGFGSQSHLKFLPENQTDFIFAVISEELGLMGVLSILFLWGVFFYRLTVLMRRARDDFALFTCMGIMFIFIIQIAVNVGGNLGLLPITGIVLPFLSYGGSALVAELILVGIAESVAAHTG